LQRKRWILALEFILYEILLDILILILIMCKKILNMNKNGNLITVFIILLNIIPILYLFFNFIHFLGKRSGPVAKCHTF